VMDVRINLDGNPKESTEEVYTARTREYLQEALGRSKTGDGEREKPLRQGKARSSVDRDFVKEISSKKTKAKTKTKLKSEVSKRDQVAAVGMKKSRAEGPTRSQRPGAKKETRVPAQQAPRRASNPQENKEKSSRWASSREPLPVTKPVTRRLLAPVAGIQTKKPTRRRVQRPDNLVGLERVDEEFERGEQHRTSSSSAALRANQLTKLPSKSTNLLGSRSAPTLSMRRPGPGAGTTASSDLEDNQPAYRVHAPMPARLLGGGPTRRPPLAPNKSAVRLAPLDALPPPAPLPSMNPSAVSSSSSASAEENPKAILRRRSSSSLDSSASSSTSLPSLAVARASRAHAASSSSSSDDQIAALFAQHAKKLSDNLEKASHMSLKYQHMKHYDGLTASSRHVESGSLLPLQRPSNQSLGEGQRPDEFVAPTKLSMII
jgi:hypothetical protein